jgi:hypothetical protein
MLARVASNTTEPLVERVAKLSGNQVKVHSEEYYCIVDV